MILIVLLGGKVRGARVRKQGPLEGPVSRAERIGGQGVIAE
jgi:hypothetical protein